eukprot:CAMPEP_0197181158 /NCGR_PEP_ID=MMETSP1423-20130617/5520_1 /TAXON_ID=476441 /ORGANISM="Pseudo-nitzschia heimii, Strain UNC1101" /LENGTH=566 /DNA_ID=CAMNT_0042631353 /DNA_START=51 /DNA_END=1751 /DNA_ORIENTATION=+
MTLEATTATLAGDDDDPLRVSRLSGGRRQRQQQQRRRSLRIAASRCRRSRLLASTTILVSAAMTTTTTTRTAILPVASGFAVPSTTTAIAAASAFSSSSTSSFPALSGGAPSDAGRIHHYRGYGSLPRSGCSWWWCRPPSLALPVPARLRASAPSSGDDWDASKASVFDSSEEFDGDAEEEEEEGVDNDVDVDDEAAALLVDEHDAWTRAVEKAASALEKKRASLKSELAKAEGAESTAARAQLLVSNLYLFKDGGTTTATVVDWENGGEEVELTLSGEYDSASAEADALFAQVRKLKRGSEIVADLLDETEVTRGILEGARSDLFEVDRGRLELVKDRLLRTARTTGFKPPPPPSGGDDADGAGGRGGGAAKARRDRKPNLGSPASNVRKLLSPGGCVVLVGRNRRGNEYLSMTVARGDDVWMHSRGCPGAHVIVQNRRGSPEPTESCLAFGADLAIFYSDLRNEQKAQVTAALPKHIQKPRGAPLGAVKLREEWKTFVGFPDRVPGFLKEARDESGQSDEYRVNDKAKHRKRTSKAAAEESAKRRRKKQQQQKAKKKRGRKQAG